MTKRVFNQRRWGLDEIIDKVKVIGCWQFIMPAKRMGLVGEFIHIMPGNTSLIQTHHEYRQMSMGFYKKKGPKFSQPKNEIVDIDLDYFVSKDLDSSDEEADIKRMREDIASAGVATLATSPGFIAPDRAVQLIKRILS